MDSFKAFALYTAIKLHFNSSYDYFKYNGKTKITVPQFEKRNDRILFEKLAKHKNPIGLLLTAFLEQDYYIRDIVNSSELQHKTIMRQARLDSITRTFELEMKKFEGKRIESLFNVKNDVLPLILTSFPMHVSAETIGIILNMYPQLGSYWEEHLKDDPLWDMSYKRLLKYAPFMEGMYNRDKIKKILRDLFFRVDVTV